jgi:chromosome segregation ATPase
MQEENDSLRLHIKKSEAELNEALAILNAVEEDINAIRENEKFLEIHKDVELSGSKREQIKNNIADIAETLKKNKQQLAELQKKLEASNLKSSALQKTVDRLIKDVDEKTQQLVVLQAELDRKEERITQLSEQVEALNTDVKALKEVNESQSMQIDSQDKALNTVFYCFGTRKELKEQQILSGGGLFAKAKALQGDFNRDYFISIDKRRVTTIPLYASKAKIKTGHPEGSYRFLKDEEGNLSLEIKDPERFWSLGVYLVIEVE